MVLKNEAWRRRLKNAKDKRMEVNLLTIGSDEDFFGLWPPIPQGNKVHDDALESSYDEEDIDEKTLQMPFIKENEDFVGNSSNEK